MKKSYKKKYQLVQAPGRETNNKYLVNVEGNLSSSVNSQFITKYSDFLLPDRSRFETIIVSKFSAIGGPEVNSRGALDRESESFSVYNSINNRNYVVRKNYNSWLSETGSNNSTNPSFHKVNKNGAKLGDKRKYDNWYVNHQIPRSEYGYAWITASVTSSISASGPYSSIYRNIDIGDLGILTGAYEFGQQLDFSGFNTFITKSIDTATDTLSFINEDSGTLHKYLLKQNGPYGYPSWRQIRTNQTPQAVYARKNNKYKISTVRKIDNNTFSSSLEQYFESPFSKTATNKVNFTIPKTKESIYLEAEKNSLIKDFGNKSLKNKIRKRSLGVKHTGYDRLIDLHKLNIGDETKPIITKIEKSDLIFPADEKIGFGKIRNKPNYAEVAGTGSNGYDRKPTVTRRFWRTNVDDRLQTSPFTAANKTGSFNALGFPETSGTFQYNTYKNASFVNPTHLLDYEFGNYYVNNLYRAPLEYKFSSWSMDKKLNKAGFVFSTGSFGFDTIRYFSGDVVTLGSLQTTPERYFYFFNQPSGTYSASLILDDTSNQYTVETFKYNPATKYRVNPTLLFAYPSLQSSYFGVNNQPPFYLASFREYSFEYKTDILSGKTPFYDSYDNFLEDIRPISKYYSIVPEFKISDYMDYIVSSSGGNFKSIDYIKNFNGYLSIEGRDLNTEISVLDNDNSINISSELTDIMEKDFSVKNHRLHLTINGLKKLLPYNGFYPQQRAVQVGDLFLQSTFGLKLGQDIEGYYETSNHNTSSISSSVSNSVGGKGAPLDAQVQTILQPFFAPGILFNTIKSGIAVDWLTVAATSASCPYSASVRNVNIDNPIMYPDISSSGVYSFVGFESPLGRGIRLPDFYGILKDKTNLYYLLYNVLYDRFISSSVDLNLRIPFEGLLSLEEAIPQDFRDRILYLLGPEYYNFDVSPLLSENANDNEAAANRLNNLRNPSFNLKRLFGKRDAFSQKDVRYKLAINNYLASTIDFFLEDGKLTSFRSSKQKDLPSFDVSKTYFMDVILRKDDDFTMLVNNLTGALAIDPTFGLGQGRFFGPTTRYFSYSSPLTTYTSLPLAKYLQYDCAYAPWTPPYWLGKSIARISFKPTLPNHTFYEIINSSSVEFINIEREKRFIDDSNNMLFNDTSNPAYNKNYALSPAYIHAMNLTSSININIIGNENTIQYNESGVPVIISEQPDDSQNFWSIQTKFETPLLNFNNSLNKNETRFKYDISSSVSFISSSTLGIWSGYGEIPAQGKSIRLGLQESFDYKNNKLSASLLQQCGFTPGFKDIGRIEDKKEISEAVVLIPYTLKKNENGELEEYALTIPQIAGENSVFVAQDTARGPFYFKIDKNVLSELIDIEYDRATIQQLQNSSIKSKEFNSIKDTIEKMFKYNIPPHLDWVTNRNINPFVMYIFEFKSILTKQDLADIWQGLMPSLSYKVDKESVSIDHPFTKNEFFHGKKLPEDIKFKIFKVKKKSKVNYYSLTDSFVDDKKFSFDFATTEKIPDYSYNYPYDFFSLVEAINVEAGIKIDTGE